MAKLLKPTKLESSTVCSSEITRLSNQTLYTMFLHRNAPSSPETKFNFYCHCGNRLYLMIHHGSLAQGVQVKRVLNARQTNDSEKKELSKKAVSFTEVFSVCQRGLWPWVGEEDPSCEGRECDREASPLVRQPHTPIPRTSCHSTFVGRDDKEVTTMKKKKVAFHSFHLVIHYSYVFVTTQDLGNLPPFLPLSLHVRRDYPMPLLGLPLERLRCLYSVFQIP